MPRIPVSNRVIPLRGGLAPIGGGGAAAGLAIVGEELERAGDVLFQVEQARTNARREIELNRSLIDFTKSMDDLQLRAEQQTDPEEMRSTWNSESAKILSESRGGIADPMVQREFEQRALRFHEERRVRVEQRATKLYQENVVATAEERSDQLANQAALTTDPVLRQQKIDEALSLWDNAGAIGALGPIQVGKAKSGVQSKVDYATALGAVLDNPARALKMLEDEAQLTHLEPISRMQLKAQAQNQLAAQAEKAAKAKTLANEKIASNLEIQIDNGQFADPETTAAQVDALHTAGVYSTAKRTEMMNKIVSVTAKKIERAQGVSLVAGAFDGSGVALDPLDKNHKEAADAYWEEMAAPRISQLPPAEQAAEVARVVEQTGVVPKAVKAMVHGGLRAGSTEQALQAANLIDRWERTAPGVLRDFDEDEIALGLAIADDMRAQVNPQTAVTNAREAASPVKEAERKYLREAYIASEPVKDNDAYLSEAAEDAEIPEAMRARYGTLVERNVVRGQSIDTARRTAFAQMKLQWAVTSVGTDGTARWQEHAPEAVYGNAKGADWINDQLIDDLKAQGIDAEGHGLTYRTLRAAGDVVATVTAGVSVPDRLPTRTVYLEPDLMSARDVSESGKPQPKYMIMTVDQTGRPVPVTDATGRPLPLWFPRYSDSWEFKEAVEFRKKGANKDIAEVVHNLSRAMP